LQAVAAVFGSCNSAFVRAKRVKLVYKYEFVFGFGAYNKA